MSPESHKHRLGWIGLGRMGYAMAERLAMAKADIRGYNRTRAKAEPLVEAGVRLVDRPSELADCDIVFTMVSTAEDLKSVTFGDDGLFSSPGRKPHVLVELSTISAEASAEIRALAGAQATEMLVVPVSGNDVVARAGRLSVMVSGPRSVFDMVAPYLLCFGSSVTYIGEGDVARVVKICHNLYLGIMFEGLAEVTLLAEKHGVSRHVFLDVINNSVLGSTVLPLQDAGDRESRLHGHVHQYIDEKGSRSRAQSRQGTRSSASGNAGGSGYCPGVHR